MIIIFNYHLYYHYDDDDDHHHHYYDYDHHHHHHHHHLEDHIFFLNLQCHSLFCTIIDCCHSKVVCSVRVRFFLESSGRICWTPCSLFVLNDAFPSIKEQTLC